jgi:hypothetical protein
MLEAKNPMTFRLSGLRSEQFSHLFGKSDAELKEAGVTRLKAGADFPCRVTLEDAQPGENVLLLTYEHQPPPSPYRAAGPIFVREGVHEAAQVVGRIPPQMLARRYSVRMYDERHWLVDGEVVAGSDLEERLAQLFEREEVSYLHLHHAGFGCYACRVDRA